MSAQLLQASIEALRRMLWHPDEWAWAELSPSSALLLPVYSIAGPRCQSDTSGSRPNMTLKTIEPEPMPTQRSAALAVACSAKSFSAMGLDRTDGGWLEPQCEAPLRAGGLPAVGHPAMLPSVYPSIHPPFICLCLYIHTHIYICICTYTYMCIYTTLCVYKYMT